MPSRNSFSIRKMLVSPRRLSLTVAAGPGSVPCDLKRYSGSSGSSGDSRLSGDTRDHRRYGQDSPQSSPGEPSQEEIDRIRAVVAAARRRLVNEGRDDEAGGDEDGKNEDEDNDDEKDDDEEKVRNNAAETARKLDARWTCETGAEAAATNGDNPETRQNSPSIHIVQTNQVSQNDANDNAPPCSRDARSEDAFALAAQRRWRWRMAGNGNGRLCLGKEGGGEGGGGGRREGERREAENGRNGEEWQENEGEEDSTAGGFLFSPPTLTLTSTATSATSTTSTTILTPATATTTTTAVKRPKKITKTAKREKEGKRVDTKREREKEKEEQKEKQKTRKIPEHATIRRRRRSPAPASDTSSCIDLLEALMVQPPADMALGRSPTFTRPREAPIPGGAPSSLAAASAPTWQTVPPPSIKHARRTFLPLRRQRSAVAAAAAADQGVQRQRSTKAAVVTTRRRRAWMRAAAAAGPSSKKAARTAAAAAATAAAVATDEPPGGAPVAKKQRHSGSTSGSGGSRWTLLSDNLFGRGRMEVNEMLSEEALQAVQPVDDGEEEREAKKKAAETDDAKASEKSENEATTRDTEEEVPQQSVHAPVQQAPLLPPCAPPPAVPLPPPPHIVMQCKWEQMELEEDEDAEMTVTTPTTALLPPPPLSPMEPFPLDDLPQRIGAAGVRLSVLLPVEEEAAYFAQQNAARRERERERAAEDAVGKESDEEPDDAKTIRAGDVTPVPPDKNPLRYAAGAKGTEGTETEVLPSVPTVLVTDADADRGVHAGMVPPRPTARVGKGKGKQVPRGKKRARRAAAAAAAAPARLAPPSSSLRVSSYRTAHGHSEEDALRYVYLHSTPFSMVMPTFRHGPVRLARPEVSGSPGGFRQPRRHPHQTDRQLQQQSRDEPLDWTAFQMAILGGAGDLFSDSIDFGHRSAADVEELDDLVAWYASLGLSDQRLVGGEEEEEVGEQRTQKPRHAATASVALPLPHIVEMPPSEARRPASVGGPFGLYSRAGLRPQFRDLGGDRVSRASRASRTSRASVASYDSLPQSPMADVVLTRGADGKEYMAPPMGHNLGHDLGDFLRWETENVYAVALE